jgi:transposase
MWKPYLRVIREKCSQALHTLDRFHIVAKMNDALDDVRPASQKQHVGLGQLVLAIAPRNPFSEKERYGKDSPRRDR